jgi:hypothetical protein
VSSGKQEQAIADSLFGDAPLPIERAREHLS